MAQRTVKELGIGEKHCSMRKERLRKEGWEEKRNRERTKGERVKKDYTATYW